MNHGIVLTSLGELEQVRDLFPDAGPIPAERALVPVSTESGPEAVASLTRAAEQAVAELDALLATDRERRQEAEQELQRWRRLGEECARLRKLGIEMREAASRAEALAEHAFGAKEREQARSVAAASSRLATEAEARATALAHEAKALAARDDVARLRAEEEAMEREQEMRATLSLAEEHLDGGRTEEARRLLDPLAGNVSSVPSLYQVFRTLRRRGEAVKLRAAEQALHEARRLHRREPVAAIDAIEGLDLDGLPDELVRHLYGCWLAACRRLGLLAAIHHRAGFGRGAVLMPAADGRWEVVSALGLPRWSRGHRIEPRSLRGARALT